MLLAAGLGTRLRPLTDEMAKPMIPIVNKPVMEHVVELLVDQGITKLYANLHYEADLIRSHFGNGSKWGVDIGYSYEDRLLGTAGGLKKLEKYFHDGTFLVISSDVLTDIDLGPLIAFHKAKKAIATVAVTHVEDPSQYGVVKLDNSGLIIGFQEKPNLEEARSNLVNCGVYVFEPEIFKYIPSGFYDFGKNLFPLLLEQEEMLYGLEHDNYWLDIGAIKTYLKGNFDALTGKVKVNIPGEQVDEKIWVGANTYISDTAKLCAPLCIGSKCMIKDYAMLIGPAVVGHNNSIEEGSFYTGGIKWSKENYKRYLERDLECVF